MIQIRPISDLRNKFTEIENLVASKKSPVFLTKNGYGSMVVMSLETYETLTENIETKSDKADSQSTEFSNRLTHEEIFSKLRAKL